VKRKWKLILGAELVVFIFGFIFFNSNQGLEANLLEVKPRSIAKTFEEEGEVVSEIQRPVYPAYGGKIVSLLVTEGQAVKKGDLLAKIDTKELKLHLEELKAEQVESNLKQLSIEQAQRELQAAIKNLERISLLYKEGAVTESEYEEAKNTVEAAENNLQQQKQFYTGSKEVLEAQINLLKHKIDNCSITAPVSGTVSNLSVKEGQVVSPNSPIMTIFRKGSYEVEVYVLAEDISNIEEGMKVELVLEKNNEDVRFEGVVKAVAPSAVETISALGLEEKRVKVTVKPVTPDKLELRPGYELDVVFTTNKQENRLVVPKTALFPYGNGEALWVVREGKAKVQPVKTGFENERDIVIEDGIREGDFIILNPQLEGLKEGKKISGKQRK